MPRLVAWQVLRSGSPTPMRSIEAAAAAAELDARDRGLARKLVGTEIRHRGTVRALLKPFLRNKPSPDFLAHLHLGVVQLVYLDRVPPHAAVNQTVGLVRDTVGQSKVKSANAILRGVQRLLREGHCGDPRRDIVGRELHTEEPVFRDPVEHPLLWAEDALSMPAQILKRWTTRFGAEAARALAEQALREPPLSIRAVAVEREVLESELLAAGMTPRPGAHPKAMLLPADQTDQLMASAAFSEGRVTVQGQTALSAAEAVQAGPGEQILDLCSAPGGKTAVLAEAGADVFASDVSTDKLELVRRTVERLNVADRVTTGVNQPGAAMVTELDYDAVLIDAPCTNTGVLSARPEARWRFGPKSKRELVNLQSELFRQGAERVRPGGRLVWSTCALDADENARAVKTFLAERSDFTLDLEQESLPDVGTTHTEGAGPVDGGYCARLVRST